MAGGYWIPFSFTLTLLYETFQLSLFLPILSVLQGLSEVEEGGFHLSLLFEVEAEIFMRQVKDPLFVIDDNDVVIEIHPTRFK